MAKELIETSCGTCRFWGRKINRSDPMGTCKRRAPRAGRPGRDATLVARRPETFHLDWCGEWEEGEHA